MVMRERWATVVYDGGRCVFASRNDAADESVDEFVFDALLDVAHRTLARLLWIELDPVDYQDLVASHEDIRYVYRDGVVAVEMTGPTGMMEVRPCQ